MKTAAVVARQTRVRISVLPLAILSEQIVFKFSVVVNLHLEYRKNIFIERVP